MGPGTRTRLSRRRDPSLRVDVDLAATTLGHPAHYVSLEPFEVALQELKSTMRWPHGGRQVGVLLYYLS